MRRFLTAVILCVAPALPSLAWNAYGHEVTAYVAWQKLTPEQRTLYSTILRAHPHYHDDLEPGIANDADHDMHVFMKAATWPDIIRSKDIWPDEKADHHPNWHYIDLPIAPTKMDAEDPKFEQTTADPTNAVQALKFEKGILDNPQSDPGKRAKALCWVLHLVGDLHQPLHCVSLYDADFPKGDKGGNSIKFKALVNDRPMNLHGFWDNLLGNQDDMVEVAKTGDSALSECSAAVADRAKNLNARDWAVDGRDLSAKVVYESLELDQKGELLQSVNRKTVDPSTLYVQRAQKTAREQAALGGTRLAGLLADGPKK